MQYNTAFKLTTPEIIMPRPKLRLVRTLPQREPVPHLPKTHACEIFPNQPKAAYRRHAVHPLGVRSDVAANLAETALAYYHAEHVGGDGRFPIQADLARVERMADFILAEDHVAGLSILRDPNDKPRDIDVEIPPGAGAVEFMRSRGTWAYCLADAEEMADGDRIKVCRTCNYPFEDKSRGKTKKDCSDGCRSIYQMLWQRTKRYGTEQLEGERRRMTLEYPFFSPQEMSSLAERSERSHGSYEKISRIDAAKKRKEKHGTQNTVRFIDKRGKKDNKYLDGVYGWVSDRNAWKGKKSEIWWGPVTTYNLADRPLTESFTECQRIIEAVNISA